MDLVKAIETQYAGCRFRSRLEARWAVFFDTIGIDWQYEPEGYELADGRRYLPDFYLPRIGWYEVKGAYPTDAEVDLLGDFLQENKAQGYLAHGSIPDPRTIISDGQPYPPCEPHDMFDIQIPGDYHYAWTICPHCRVVGIEYDARSSRVTHTDTCVFKGDYDDKRYNGDDELILKAYAAARSARFEHAEREVW